MPYQIYVYSAAMQHTSLLKPFMELWCIFVSSKSHKSSCLEIICFLAGESKEGEGRPVGSICSFMQAQEENSGHLAPWQLQRQPYGLAYTHTQLHVHKRAHRYIHPLGKCSLPLFLYLTKEIAVTSQIPARHAHALAKKSHPNPVLTL